MNNYASFEFVDVCSATADHGSLDVHQVQLRRMPHNASHHLPAKVGDDRTSGNRAITDEMSANPRLSAQVDPMSDD